MKSAIFCAKRSLDTYTIHERTTRSDSRRDEKLRRLGYHVLRLDAALVLRDPEAAVALVRAAVERLR